MRSRFLSSLRFAACLAAALVTTAPAQAYGIDVTSTADESDFDPSDDKCLTLSGNCTLRAAVEQANAFRGGPYTITLQGETYTLNRPLSIVAHIRIDGKRDGTVIDCKGSSNFLIGGYLELHELTVRECPEIENAGVLDLFYVTLEGSTGDTALWNTGNLLVAFSTLRGNRAVAGSAGGAALFNDAGGFVHVAESTFEGNVSETHGGAILNRGELSMVIGQFRDNIAEGDGGAIWNTGSLRFELVTFARNGSLRGGALFHEDGQVESLRTGFVNNQAGFQGGAIWSGAPLQLVNSTVSGNRAPEGGGLYGRGEPNALWLANATITGNTASPTEFQANASGGGLYGTARLRNTILAGNTSIGRGQDCFARTILPLSEGYNILGVLDECGLPLLQSDRAGRLRRPLDARLRPLDASTWWPPFHALDAQSPAVDRGNPDGCNMPITEALLDTDQLEKTRHQGGACDVGAVELLP